MVEPTRPPSHAPIRLPLSALAARGVARPWAEGDNIPWNDPEFSERMLREHLTQDHDAASRRSETIERQVRFLHEQILGGQPARVLDLGCGPGLYASRLARLGHTVRGVDFSPASIAYARQQDCCGMDLRYGADPGEAPCPGSCEYVLSDVRAANFVDEQGPGWDLVMMIYGEFNVFRPEDARGILRRAAEALRPGGRLLLEVSHEAAVRRLGAEPPSWSAQAHGLFSARPHLLLTEAFWDEGARAATHRYWVVDTDPVPAGAGLPVRRYAASYQARALAEFEQELAGAGLGEVAFYSSLEGGALDGEPREEFVVVAGRKPVLEGVGDD